MRLRGGKMVTSSSGEEEGDLIDNNKVDIKTNGISEFKTDDEEEKANLEGDYKNIALLLLLYVLQGVPLGMAGSLPMILQNKNIGYKKQAMFSLVYWPFSLKLLWAPIVDAIFVQTMGRRKSWLVPVQYLIGFFMLVLSSRINAILDAEIPDVLFLTIVFFALNFLAATQDIAVDGWALTMLQRRNVAYASTCNAVGQTAGYFIGNVVLLAFTAPEFCNKYIRSTPQDVGILTLPDFLFYWGVIFLVTTTLVWLFKREKHDEDIEDHGIVGSYMMLGKILKLPAIQELVLISLTVRFGFAAADAVTGLKLIEAGVPKESLAMIAVPLVPLQILLPFILSKMITGPRPLDVFAKAVPCRLVMGGVFALVVYWTKSFNGNFPYYYFALIVFVYALHQISAYSMNVAMLSFYAKISDPKIGGTYMTLLNTICNLGAKWPTTLMLWFVDPLTVKECVGVSGNLCASADEIKACTTGGGNCVTSMDGYYFESVLCIVVGFLWLRFRGHTLRIVQSYKPSAWNV